MRLQTGLRLAALLTALLLIAPPAVACLADVDSAKKWLAELQQKAATETGSLRKDIDKLLADAAKELGEADADCVKADNMAARTLATLKVTGARSSMTTAWTLMKVN